MAPLVDMVFLLLVFFMCVTTWMEADRGPEVALAAAHTAVLPTPDGPRATLTVVAADGVYAGSKRLAEPALRTWLAQVAAEPAGPRLVIRAAATTPYEEVSPVLAAAAEAGLTDVIFATVEAP